MALMNIRIGGVPIDLISGITQTSNSCYSIYEFTIISTAGANININLNRDNTIVEDYDYAEIKVGSTWRQFIIGTDFVMGSTGQAKFRLTIGNVSLLAIKYPKGNTPTGQMCNTTTVTITDNTNDKAEYRRFARCTQGDRCNNNYTTPPPPLTIEQNTNIYIFFDSSGSMDDTLLPLQNMRDQELKGALLPYYNNNEAIYNARVNVIENPQERTLDMLRIENDAPTIEKTIVLVFQDETDKVYHGAGWTINSPRNALYNNDMTLLRNRLSAYTGSNYRAVIFQVNTGPDSYYTNFKAFIKSLEYGSGSYAGVNGLSDRTEFNYKYDVTQGGQPTYYKNLIIQALEELGFII